MASIKLDCVSLVFQVAVEVAAALGFSLRPAARLPCPAGFGCAPVASEEQKCPAGQGGLPHGGLLPPLLQCRRRRREGAVVRHQGSAKQVNWASASPPALKTGFKLIWTDTVSPWLGKLFDFWVTMGSILSVGGGSSSKWLQCFGEPPHRRITSWVC